MGICTGFYIEPGEKGGLITCLPLNVKIQSLIEITPTDNNGFRIFLDSNAGIIHNSAKYYELHKKRLETAKRRIKFC